MGTASNSIRRLLLVLATIYLLYRLAKGIQLAATKPVDVVLGTRKSLDGIVSHPLYTFCPHWVNQGMDMMNKTFTEVISEAPQPTDLMSDPFDIYNPYLNDWRLNFHIYQPDISVNFRTLSPCFTAHRRNIGEIGNVDSVADYGVKNTTGLNDLEIILHEQPGFLWTHLNINGNRQYKFGGLDPVGHQGFVKTCDIEQVAVEPLPNDICSPELTEYTADKCIEDYAEAQLGCKLPWVIAEEMNDPSIPVCSSAEDLERFINLFPDLRTTSPLQKQKFVTSIGCKIPCVYKKYNLQESYSDSFSQSLQSTLHLEFNLELAEKIHTQVLVYSWTSLFGDIGGYVGLLLGFSCLTVFDLVLDTTVSLVRKCLAKKKDDVVVLED